MCLTTFIPVIDAANVQGIVTLKLPEGISIYDEDGDKIQNDTTAAKVIDYYAYTVNSGVVTFSGYSEGEETNLLKDDIITLYTDADLEPETKVAGNIASSVQASDAVLENSGTAKWMITVEVKRTLTKVATLTITPTLPKYTVTFTSAAGCAFLDAETGNALISAEYTGTSDVKFKLPSVANGKKPVIYQNGEKISPTPGADGVYSITVNGATTFAVQVEDITYSVTGSSGDGYTYAPNGSTEVAYGGSFSFFVNPANGYGDIKSVTYTMDGVEGSKAATKVSGTQYVINNITGAVVITVVAGDAENYTVTAPTGAGFEVKDITPASVGYGKKVTFNVEAKEGYDVTSVSYTMNGKTISLGTTAKEYEIKNITGDVTINVTATRKTLEVTVDNAGLGNATTTAANKTVSYGDDYTFYVTPAAGYNPPKVMVNGAEIKSVSNNLYTITNITEAKAITFESGTAIERTVTLIGNGEGFDYAADMQNKVNDGKSYVITVTVKDEYSNSKATINVNGSPVPANQNGNVYTYMIPSVTSDITVSVTGLVMNTYKITLTPGAGYTLTAIGDTTVSYGADFSFRLDTDASVANATVKCTNDVTATKDESGVYTIEGVTSNITVTVTTEGKTFAATVNNDEGDHATVTPVEGNTADSIPYNGDYSFTVAPETGYSIAKVSVNGSEITAINGTYTVHGVVRDLTIVVETVENTLTVNYRSTEKNHEYTETKVYTYTELETATLPELNTCDLHTFMGWSDGSGEYVTTLDTKYKDDVAKANVTVNLTAEYTVKEDTIRNLLSLKKTEGEATKLADNTYRITFRTSVGAKDSVDACVRDLVMITKHGTMLANTNDVNFATVTFTANSETGIYSGINGSDGDKDVYLYYVECGYSWDAFNAALVADISQKTNQIILRVSSVTESDTLNAAGWVEVKVGDDTFRIISDESGVVTISAN